MIDKIRWRCLSIRQQLRDREGALPGAGPSTWDKARPNTTIVHFAKKHWTVRSDGALLTMMALRSRHIGLRRLSRPAAACRHPRCSTQLPEQHRCHSSYNHFVSRGVLQSWHI